MSEMIERGARVICEADCRGLKSCIDDQKRNAPCRATVDQLILFGHWETAAKFIGAMREPTTVMVLWNNDPQDAEYNWTAMIDAALAEEKQPA